MNILYLTKEYKHKKLPNSGGTGSFISNISKKLVKNGHSVYVFSLSKNEIFIDDCGVTVYFGRNNLIGNFFFKQLKSISRKIFLLNSFHIYLLKLELEYFANQMYLYIKKNNLKIDIIETHDFDGISLYLNDTIPYVVRCHGSFSIFNKYFGFDVEKPKLLFEKMAMKKAINIITISKYSQKLNHEFFNLNETKLIYNGIDNEVFKLDSTLEKISNSIFFFGNISDEKGADIAIKVLIEVLKKYQKASLHFIGIETKYKEVISKIIDENRIEKSVVFHGFQHQFEIIKLLSKAEVVIFPSKGETFGLGLCEAMLLSKPIICSNIPSFIEIVEHEKTGFIANNIDEYVNFIDIIFKDVKITKSICREARNSIKDKFNINNMTNQTISHYELIIENTI